MAILISMVSWKVLLPFFDGCLPMQFAQVFPTWTTENQVATATFFDKAPVDDESPACLTSVSV